MPADKLLHQHDEINLNARTGADVNLNIYFDFISTYRYLESIKIDESVLE
jgi:hypothetical protein